MCVHCRWWYDEASSSFEAQEEVNLHVHKIADRSEALQLHGAASTDEAANLDDSLKCEAKSQNRGLNSEA